jgi:pimeloyl-ACP methyl ester carboxylesterase
MAALRHTLSLVCLLFLALPAAADPGSTGIVLMHGKWGSPDKGINEVEAILSRAGYTVVSPEMPWSGKRLYDVGWDGAMAEIDKAIAQLKTKGASRFVVGGHSFGANAAIGYAAGHPEIVGVLAMAPGHVPERFARHPAIAAGLEKAKARVAEGKGESYANFTDLNQGKSRDLSIYPTVFLSYFDPLGPAIMPRNAAKMSPGTALMWVIGTNDPLFPAGKAYAFDFAPANAKNLYHVVEADHFQTPSVAREAILAWVKSLE